MKNQLIIFITAFIVLVGGVNRDIFADIYAGLGYSGVTLGRNIPALHLAVSTDTLRFSLISAGVKTEVYYHNAYQASLLSTWKPGELLWGKVEAGFGGGILHAVRGYREDTDEDYERESNTVWGPTIYVGWEIFPNVVISIEAIYGIYSTEALALVFQENCVGSIGVRF